MPLRRRRAGRFSKGIPEGYELELSSAEIEAWIEILEAFNRRRIGRTSGMWGPTVGNADEVLQVLGEHRQLLEPKAQEMRELLYQEGVIAPWSTVGVRCSDKSGVAPEEGVALTRWDVKAMGFYTWVLDGEPLPFGVPPAGQARQTWLSRLDSNEPGSLCQERLRMLLGSATRCGLCKGYVIPPRPVLRDSRVRESEFPLKAGLCESCIKKELGDRAREWDRFTESDKLAHLERLRRVGRRGHLP